MTEKIFVFESILGNLMEDFILEKRSVGYKFQKGASMLKRFDILITQKGLNEKKLTKEMILLWTEKSPNETNATRWGRISIARGFAQYMVRLGYQAHIYPISTVTINRYSYIPYMFSEEEIKTIFHVCDHYQISECSPNRHLILPLLFRILYGCGLRISEALNLKYEDVDLEHGTLFIRNAKFGKERIVPMARILSERCHVYMEELNSNKVSSNFFFPSPYGGQYKYSTIYKLFRGILWESGI